MGLLSYQPTMQAVDANGAPAPQARRYICRSGTDNLARIYSDRDLTYTQANPMISDDNGVFAACYLPEGSYRVRVEDRRGVTLLDENDISVALDAGVIVVQEGSGGQLQFASVADLLLDQTLSYSVGENKTIVGLDENVLASEPGVQYKIAASGATDYHVITAGGVKLYAVPDACGVISTEQLGWSDGEDVTDALVRFWPRFGEGQTLLFCHSVNVGSVYFLIMPKHFTLAAKRKRVDGINFTTAAFPDNKDKFRMSEGCSILDMRWTADSTSFVDGTFIRGGDGNELLSVPNCRLEGNYFDVAVDVPVRFFNPYKLVVRGNEFRDGLYFLGLDGSRMCRIEQNSFNSDTASAGNHEHIKTGNSPVQGNVGLYIGHNEFIRPARDGIDCTGALTDAVIECNRFIENGGWTDGSSGVGFGGIDIKTVQEYRDNPRPRNFNVTIRDNYFKDSWVSCVNNFGTGSSTGAPWTDPTPDELLEFGTTEIFLRGNVFDNTEDNTLKCGFSGSGNCYLEGDTFLGGAFFYPSQPFSMVGRNLHLELIGGGLNNKMQVNNCRNWDLHFRMIETRAPIAPYHNWISIKNGSSNIRMAGNVDIRHGGLISLFDIADDCSDITVSLSGKYTGGGTAPYVVMAGSGAAESIKIQDCDLTGFRSLIRLTTSNANPPTQNVSVANNTFRAGTSGLIDFRTLANKSNVDGISIIGNKGDGTTPIWTGTDSLVVWADIAQNAGFTSSPAIPVADLPSGYYDQRMLVNDAAATTWWNVVAGGGANTVPVTFDGSSWRVG